MEKACVISEDEKNLKAKLEGLAFQGSLSEGGEWTVPLRSIRTKS